MEYLLVAAVSFAALFFGLWSFVWTRLAYPEFQRMRADVDQLRFAPCPKCGRSRLGSEQESPLGVFTKCEVK